MALLTPNTTYTMNGVPINEKIIPDGTKWKDGTKAKKAGFAAGQLYKRNDPIPKVRFITIHNTEDLKNVKDDAEQYTRATYNENMGSVRVLFYVDENGAWQNLKAGTGLSKNDPSGSAEIAWHSGDGSVADGGNMTSIAFEVVMNETKASDEKTMDYTARMVAWLLKKYNLTVNDVVTHTYWVNKSAGNKFSDRDEQCTNFVYGKKWCPAYIFGSTNHATALKNWKAFKQRIQTYLDQLGGTTGSGNITVVPKKIYTVQVGAFSVKSNADAMVKKLQQAGFQAFVTEKK